MKSSNRKEGMEMFEMVPVTAGAVIKVIGIGGGGGNSVKRMMASGVQGVEFICANTDSQALQQINAPTTLQLGQRLTQGLGVGGSPERGREAALEDRGYISEIIEGTDLLFITAGMGGGTGTGAAPVVAEIAQEKGVLTVAVVTLPFEHERRMKQACQGLENLDRQVDSLIVVPNQKLMSILSTDISMAEAFLMVDEILMGAVRGIADLIIHPGIINLDFADVRMVMGSGGRAIMGSGRAQGESRVHEALDQALHNPLLEDVDYQKATGVLVNISTGSENDLKMKEVEEIGNTIGSEILCDAPADEVHNFIGTAVNPELEENLQVTIIVAGVENQVAHMPAASQRTPREQQSGVLAKIRQPLSKEDLNTIRARGEYDYHEIPPFLRRQVD